MTGLRLDGRHYVSVILVMVAFLLAACGPDPTATPTAEPEATEAPAASSPAATSVPEPTKAAAPTDTPAPTPTARPAATVAPTNTPVPVPTPTLDLVAIKSNLPPQIFVGTAKIDGNLAPPGTIVEALIGDKSVGKGVVQADGIFTPVRVSFPRQTVTFTVGGFDATQTGRTEVGGGTVINLTASSR